MEGSESILPCTRDLGGQNNSECVPLSMTGTELLARLRQWLADASNCSDGMNTTTKVFFDEIEELCKERQLNIRIFHNKNVENEDGEIHHTADHAILKRFFEVFNTVIFGGALPARLCSWRFHRKGSKEWEENQKVRDLGAANDYRFPGMGTRADGALASFDLYELPTEEDETSLSSDQHLLQYLEIMVHEMVHCLVFVYICGCDECRARLDNPDGSTGHALEWAVMAHEIEIFALQMLNIKLDLNVRGSVGLELFATQESPDRWPIEELEIDWEDLEDCIKWAREHVSTPQ